MSFEQEFMHGHEKYAENFDKWGEKAYSILGKITQCGIAECDKSGMVLVATNRPDFGERYLDAKGYMLDREFTYITNAPVGFLTLMTNDGFKFLRSNETSLFGKEFDLWEGFSFCEKINDDINRYYLFSSDTPEIYDNLINNVSLVKKFIKHFKEENEYIINYYRERKFNLAEKKDTYFVNNINYHHQTDREKVVNILHTLDLLEQDKNISEREWQCLELYCQGRSASQTSEILGISRRTIETHFNNLKNKLQIRSKSELIDTIN